ncbi:MAG: hypothetical protein ACLFQ6_11530 [Candidatus Sumerlaeia bacterium]
MMGNGWGAYVCFGQAFGIYNETQIDVHGTGAQRSDPKSGDPMDYLYGHGPQNDEVRIYNYVRLVRDADNKQVQAAASSNVWQMYQ